MSIKPLAGLALIALGAAALAWPELSYTKQTHDAKLGPLEFTVKEKDTVRLPVWLGLAAIAGGTVLVWKRKA
ncbi:hypothetical protein GETHLI_28190 [Geothrix limicola]|uniref:LPXTG cell wall anchor domain-containing protein n=1 Tax=Geothrix limicola TaxID=2927978 RepID=A0ABQ5QHJ3_9BACT|nr:hypothetical protein [Geothrix limicola]GLH74317.1 hypothetical protein GETHLI_28190 [Geothrix limicola]